MSDETTLGIGGIDWSTISEAESLAALYGWQGEGVRAVADPAEGEPGLVLTPRLWERLQAFALTAKPQRCCGVGIGPPGEVREFHPVENVHEQPATRHEMSSTDRRRLQQRAQERGWDVTLVFRSHPATDPEPSSADRSLVDWPDAVHAILGLAGPAAPKLRAWRIRGGADGGIAELGATLAR